MLVMTVPEWLVERGSILITGNISFKSNIFLRWLCSLVVVTVKRIVGERQRESTGVEFYYMRSRASHFYRDYNHFHNNKING
jgi:hypothetical protein